MVQDAVDAISGRGDPGDEQHGKEQNGALGVGPHGVVRLMHAPALRLRLHVGCCSRDRQGRVVAGGDVHYGALVGDGVGCCAGYADAGVIMVVAGEVGVVGGLGIALVVGVGGDGDGYGTLGARFGVVSLADRGMWEGNVSVGGRGRGDDFGRLGDFGRLVVVSGSEHVDEGAALGAAGSELVHDLALLVDVAAGTDVDGGRYDDAEPRSLLLAFRRPGNEMIKEIERTKPAHKR